MHFKTALSIKYLNIASSKYAFQKNISKLFPQNLKFKSTCQISPSKNAFKNCYKLSIGNKNKNPVGLKTLDM